MAKASEMGEMCMKKLILAVNELEELLKCNRCGKIVSDPCQFDNCDHLFCKACSDYYVGNECPICDIPVGVKDRFRSPEFAAIVEQFIRLRSILATHSGKMQETLVSNLSEEENDNFQVSTSSPGLILSESGDDGVFRNENVSKTSDNIPKTSKRRNENKENNVRPVKNTSKNSAATSKTAEKRTGDIENDANPVNNVSKTSDKPPVTSEEELENNKNDVNPVENVFNSPNPETPETPEKIMKNAENSVAINTNLSTETPTTLEKVADKNENCEMTVACVPENRVQTLKTVEKKLENDENSVEDVSQSSQSIVKTSQIARRTTFTVDETGKRVVETVSSTCTKTFVVTDKVYVVRKSMSTSTNNASTTNVISAKNPEREIEITEIDENANEPVSMSSNEVQKRVPRNTTIDKVNTTLVENVSKTSTKTQSRSEKINYNKSNNNDTSHSSNTSLTTSSKHPKTSEKKNSKGETALHTSVIKGNFDDVQRLLQQKFDVNAKDNAGWTPLHEAAIKGHKNIVAVLLDNGALIDSPGGENNTPLHDAVLNGHVDVVSMLVRRGANLHAKNLHGLSPMNYANSSELKEAFKTPVLNIKNPSFSNVDVKEKNIILSFTGLNESERHIAKEFASQFGIEIAREVFDETATHLITKCKDGDNKTCPRTMKYMVGIVTGKWIVDYSWVTECLKTNTLVNETEFEITGCTSNPNTNGPKRGRENAAKKLPRLFSDCKFYFFGDFPSPSKLELTQLTQLSGGAILKRLPVQSTLSSNVITPYHASEDLDLKNCSNFLLYSNSASKPLKFLSTEYLKILPTKFLFNCIAKFELILDGDLK